ncbi:hypothetical protein BD310DRAFT_862151, partial [Dichomitus squalens]
EPSLWIQLSKASDCAIDHSGSDGGYRGKSCGAHAVLLPTATPLAPSPALQIHSLVSRIHDDPREAQPDTTHIHSVIAYRVRTSNANVDRTCKLSLPLHVKPLP